MLFDRWRTRIPTAIDGASITGRYAQGSPAGLVLAAW